MLLRTTIFWLVLSVDSVLSIHSKRFTILYPKVKTYEYETRYFETLIDHFSFVGDSKFLMKYLISTKYHTPNGPILFYTGNEGPIEAFAENTGFMWEHAEELQAALVFAEHRFYGTSLPFGNESLKDPQHFGFLTAEQALADYAELLSNLTASYDRFKSSPVIAIGGSYGGMLAAWMRMKYPNLVLGSIASSAPVWMFPNLSNCGGFNRVATEAFVKKGSEGCKKNIAAVWNRIMDLSTGPSGMVLLTKMFMLCEPLTEVQKLIDYLTDVLGTVAMVNYPYNASFLGQFPAWPVTYLCKELEDFDPDEPAINAASRFATAVRSLTNYTKTQKCIDLSSSSGDIEGATWELQTCMEMVEPICSDSTNSMFPPVTWDADRYSLTCYKKYAVRPRFGWANIQFFGKSLRSASNIVFSNGDLDPWSAFGVLDNGDVPHCNVIRIPNGAHHLDLRAAHALDPDDVKAARADEMEIMHKWLAEWRLHQSQRATTRTRTNQPRKSHTIMDVLVYMVATIRGRA